MKMTLKDWFDSKNQDAHGKYLNVLGSWEKFQCDLDFFQLRLQIELPGMTAREVKTLFYNVSTSLIIDGIRFQKRTVNIWDLFDAAIFLERQETKDAVGLEPNKNEPIEPIVRKDNLRWIF